MTAKRCGAVCSVVPFLVLGLPRVQAASFEPLDFGPSAVSEDGSVVVGAAQLHVDGLLLGQAIRWTAESGAVGLGFLRPEDERSPAYDVSADGTVVAGASYGEAIEAFRWTAETGIVGLGFLPETGRSCARGVSADGSVVVGYSVAEAFRWAAEGGMLGLGTLPESGWSEAYGVSADGSVVVGRSSGKAFRWTADGGMLDLGFLPGQYYAWARAVSADGAVVVGYSGGEAFRWTAWGGMVGLGILQGPSNPVYYESRADAVSGDGSVVVGTTIHNWPLDHSIGAWIWDQAHGMRDLEEVLSEDFGLDLTGWNLRGAHDISDDGRVIVGWGKAPSGEAQGFRAVIPEPSTLALLITAAVALALYARFRRKPR